MIASAGTSADHALRRERRGHQAGRRAALQQRGQPEAGGERGEAGCRAPSTADAAGRSRRRARCRSGPCAGPTAAARRHPSGRGQLSCPSWFARGHGDRGNTTGPCAGSEAELAGAAADVSAMCRSLAFQAPKLEARTRRARVRSRCPRRCGRIDPAAPALPSPPDRVPQHLANRGPDGAYLVEDELDILGADEVRFLLGHALVLGDEVLVARERPVALAQVANRLVRRALGQEEAALELRGDVVHQEKGFEFLARRHRAEGLFVDIRVDRNALLDQRLLAAGPAVRSDHRVMPQRDSDPGIDDVGHHLGLVGRQRARGHVDLVLLESLVDVADRWKAGDGLIGEVHDLEGEPDPRIVRRPAAVAAEIDFRRLGDIGRLLQPRWQVLARIGDGPAGCAPDRHVVLGQLDLERRIVDQRRRRTDREEAGGEAVRLRSDVEPQQIHGMQAARAGRVLDDDCRAAGNVFRQVARQDSRLGVDIAAGTVVDHHGERLAFVELRERGRRKRDRGEHRRRGRRRGHFFS